MKIRPNASWFTSPADDNRRLFWTCYNCGFKRLAGERGSLSCPECHTALFQTMLDTSTPIYPSSPKLDRACSTCRKLGGCRLSVLFTWELCDQYVPDPTLIRENLSKECLACDHTRQSCPVPRRRQTHQRGQGRMLFDAICKHAWQDT